MEPFESSILILGSSFGLKSSMSFMVGKVLHQLIGTLSQCLYVVHMPGYQKYVQFRCSSRHRHSIGLEPSEVRIQKPFCEAFHPGGYC